MSIAERFGENLRQARKDADLSQEEAGIRASLRSFPVGLLAMAAAFCMLIVELAFQ